MSENGCLSGLSVLVVEDDFYQADDAQHALEADGARVLGPYSDFEDAQDILRQSPPDCAVVDLNLGAGPDFSSARMMNDRGIPLLFVTGYDPKVIPSDLAHVRCLQKPTSGNRIARAVRELCGR